MDLACDAHLPAVVMQDARGGEFYGFYVSYTGVGDRSFDELGGYDVRPAMTTTTTTATATTAPNPTTTTAGTAPTSTS